MHESLESENPSPASEHSVKQILKLYAKENTPLVTYATDGGILTSKIYFFMLYRIKQKWPLDWPSFDSVARKVSGATVQAQHHFESSSYVKKLLI